MRRWLIFLGIALFCGSLAPADAPAADPFPNLQNDPLYDRETAQALHDVIIDASWNQKELGQVLRDLTLTVRTARPISADINFFMSSSAPQDVRHRRVTLTMRRAPVLSILENLAQQAGFTIRVHPGVVLIAPR
jgi:hypothetical protein